MAVEMNSLLPSVAAQTICFPRFDESFYARSLAGIVDFLSASAKVVPISLYVYQHEIRLSNRLRQELIAAAELPVQFRVLEHRFQHPREDPAAYAKDLNAIYARCLEATDEPYVFHVDGDVQASTPQWGGAHGKAWLAEWLRLVEDPAVPFDAVCNIGSRYFAEGPPIYEWYRPYHYACQEYVLRFSTQSYFCRRDLLPWPESLDVTLERAVTKRLEAAGTTSLNLYRRPGFSWTHHYHGNKI